MVTNSTVFKRYKCFKSISTRLWAYEQGLHQVQARALHVCGFHDPKTLSSMIWTKIYHVQECKVTNQWCMGSKDQTTTTTTNQETTINMRAQRPSTKLQLGATDTLMDSNGTKIHLRDTLPIQWVTRDFSIVPRPPRASQLGMGNHKSTPLTQTTTNNTNQTLTLRGSTKGTNKTKTLTRNCWHQWRL